MGLPVTPFRFIFHFVCRQGGRFALLILSFILWAVSDSVFPYFLKKLINAVAPLTGDAGIIFQAAKGPLLMLALFWGVAELCMRVQGVTQIYTFPRFRANIREAVFEYVKSHSHQYFSSQFSGNISKKLADLPKSCQTIMEIFCLQFTSATAGSLIVLVMVWWINSLFGLILLVWLVIHFALNLLFLRYGNTLWEIHASAENTLSGNIVDIFTNMSSVRLFARGNHETFLLQRFQNEEMGKARRAMWLSEIMRAGLGLNGLCLVFGMLFALLLGWTHHWVTLGDFTQISMQAFWLLGWVWYITFQLPIFTREVGVVTDALSLVARAHDVTDKKNAGPIYIRRGEIRFENVRFGYQKNRPVFEDLTVVVAPGEKVGLVGSSGSGKSTFVNLVLRFYDLQGGHILIDGQNIADVQQDSLRSQIAIIPQDPSLFHRSLLENIRYGRPDATDEQVMTASTLAHCHEFIEKMDGKYHAMAGERGMKLSGGQRQRIAIARAILKNAPVLILDEATSALDSVTERLIQDSLHRLMQGRTALVVAHRLSTLADMDRIIVLHRGRIVEEGTHDALLAHNGRFAEMWSMQTDGFLPEDDSEEDV